MTRTIQILRGTTAQNNAFTGAAGELTMDTTRKELRVHDGSTVGGKVVSLTPGFLAPFAGSTAPDGWLICDGSAVSRITYAGLFAVIGTTYGAGDGNSTFNLPDYTNVRDGAFFDYSTRYQLATNVSDYTMTEDGYIWVSGRNIGAWDTLKLDINGNRVLNDRNAYRDNKYPANVFAIVSKGDVLHISPNEDVYFYPAKGTKRPSNYCIKY